MYKTSPLRAFLYLVMAAVLVSIGLAYHVSPIATVVIALVSAFVAEVVVVGDD